MEMPDPMQILAESEKNEASEEQANLSQALDRFEATIWPIYERRGYSRDFALLSYSLGIFSPDLVVIESDGDDAS